MAELKLLLMFRLCSKTRYVQKGYMLDRLLTKSRLEKFPDIAFIGGNAYEIQQYCESLSTNHVVTPSGNRIIFKRANSVESLKKTFVYFSGKGSTIILENLKGVYGLDIACVNGSQVHIKAPVSVRGLTILCSQKSRIGIDSGCLISRDVVIYASNAHALYNVADGMRRFKAEVVISKHVWLGQGTRILTGARVGAGSVIGSYSVLSGRIPNNCAAAGNPCRVTSKDIFWTSANAVKDQSYYEYLASSGHPKPDFIKLTENSE